MVIIRKRHYSYYYFFVTIVILLTTSMLFTDAAWPTKGSGNQYNSLTAFGRLLGGYTQKVIDSRVLNRLCRLCEVAKRKGKKVRKHDCIKNFTGSAKAMEAEAIFQMVTSAPSLGHVVHWLVSDDDSVMRAHLRHPLQPDPNDTAAVQRQKMKKDKGRLPPWIQEPVFMADPTHHNK